MSWFLDDTLSSCGARQPEATDSKSLVEEHSKSATVDLINRSLLSPMPCSCIEGQGGKEEISLRVV